MTMKMGAGVKIQGIVMKVLLMLRIIMVTSNAVDVGKVRRYLEKIQMAKRLLNRHRHVIII